ncbi:MAG: serine/threonine-protein phosphatase, partial [Nocardioides sp.]|nr:serine/threonine-protein phosphatase [Nocardioides sp.]
MPATYDAAQPARAPRWLRSWQLFLRRGLSTEFQVALWLALAAMGITVAVAIWPVQMPFTALMLPLLVASVLLGPRTLPWFVTFLIALLAVTFALQVEITSRTIAATVVQLTMGIVVLAASARRSALGVAGIHGETMFIDLRDRILTQGGIPDLPPGWQVQSALRSAGGTPFAGDFVVAARRGDHLEVVVVVVSGQGAEA